MATLQAHRTFSILNIYAFNFVVTSTSPSKIIVYDPNGTTSITYTGSFKYDGAGNTLSSETIKKVEVFDSGSKHYTITGSYDAVTYIDNSWADTQILLDYVFAGDDTFKGSSGNDIFVFSSGIGNDKFYGFAGNDIITTNYTFSSFVDGGTGDDYILFGGRDTLKGGKGIDTFDVYLSNTTSSIIQDFSLVDDKIVMTLGSLSTGHSVLDSKGNIIPGLFLLSSDQIAVGKGVVTAAQDNNDIFVYDLKTGKLYIDFDGVGGDPSDLLVTFLNKPQFTASQLADALYLYEESVSSASSPFFTDYIHTTSYGLYDI